MLGDLKTYQVRNCQELVPWPILYILVCSKYLRSGLEKRILVLNKNTGHDVTDEKNGLSHFSTLQVDALEGHDVPSSTGWFRVEQYLKSPISEVDPMDFNSKIDQEKQTIAPIWADIADAKRRVTAAKGPKKNSKKAADHQSTDEETNE